MAQLIHLAFDGGLKEYSIGLDKIADNIKSFRKLFEMIVDYFEGITIPGMTGLPDSSPIVRIWKSEGEKIGANWQNKSDYEVWKQKFWSSERKYSIPIDNISKQVLTGHTLHALLNSDDPWAVRMIDDMTMVYGLENEYSKYWQEKRRILDFFPDMAKEVNRIVAYFAFQNSNIVKVGEE